MLAGSERQRDCLSGRREAVMCKIMRTLGGFIRRETVLFISIVLALISAVFVPPSREYISYIDWDTLFLLFSLMAVVKGFQKTGLFLYLGGRMLKKTTTTRQMLLILVFLPFLFSMVITNDVSLITFVPFGLAVLRMTGQERLAVPLLVLQTIAANLGSMLTPMGNPQNLYLYGRAGIGFWGLCKWMLPYVLLSAAGLFVLILLRRSIPISAEAVEVKWEHPRVLPFLRGGICPLPSWDFPFGPRCYNRVNCSNIFVVCGQEAACQCRLFAFGNVLCLFHFRRKSRKHRGISGADCLPIGKKCGAGGDPGKPNHQQCAGCAAAVEFHVRLARPCRRLQSGRPRNARRFYGKPHFLQIIGKGISGKAREISSCFYSL